MAISRRNFVRGVAGAAVISSSMGLSNCKTDNKTSANDKPKTPSGPARKKYDAIVVGAGLSGLNAATLLEESGLDVLVLEGRNRLGGRVYTLEDIPGKPEAAGEYIGANYARMISTANRLRLELHSPEANNNNRPWMYRIKGQNITAEDWASSPLNPIEGENRDLLPHRFLSTISHQDNPLLDKPLDHWLTKEFQKYDIPHNQYLRSKGVNEETIRLMNVIIHSGGMSRTSAINELRRYHVNGFNSKLSFPDGKSWKMVKGGNSLLSRGMANSLSNEVLLNKTVIGFREENGAVEVHCTDGEIRDIGIRCQVKHNTKLSNKSIGLWVRVKKE